MKLNVKDKFKKIKKGQLIGNWEIVTNQLTTKNKALYVKCICNSCNTEKEINAYRLLSGKTNKCSNCRVVIYKGILLSVFNKIKLNAQKRNIEFNITMEDIGDLFEKQNGKCALSGIKLKLKKTTKDKNSTASLDRRDNNKGYLKDNIQWIYRPINFMKGTLDEGEFIFLCEKIIFNKKKKVK